MPNSRGSKLTPADLETAHNWGPGRFAEPEPQEARGAVGARGQNRPVRVREKHRSTEWTGVNPLQPIMDSMPNLKPGDQGG